MIKSALYRDPKLLDSTTHRHKRIRQVEDWSIAKDMHAVFLAATEFPAACRSYPIVFVNTSERLPDGHHMVTPVALLGIAHHENLYLDGSRWDADYLPAFIRRFPFLTAGVPGSRNQPVYVDAGWAGFGDDEGEPLFDAHGKPTPVLQRAMEFLQQFDAEQQRTRQFAGRLIALNLLKDVTFDATLPSGEALKVKGFLIVDEEKMAKLSDHAVLDLHRSGMLLLLHAHLVSIANVQVLVERKARRAATAMA